MLLFLAAVVVGGAILWGSHQIARELRAAHASEIRARALDLELIATFAPGVAACANDPRALLVWQPLATAARALHPDEFASLDRAAGETFPFSRSQLQAAHARWTTDWLVWERANDVEFKLKAAAAEAELAASGGALAMRARLEAVEQEKLERYQRRYEEYVRTSKALQHLIQE